MKKNKINILLLFAIIVTSSINAQEALYELPKGFVYAKEHIPSLRTDLRYYSSNNFIGKPVDGYIKPRLILTKKATEALKKVQNEFERLGFGLLIYDAYRPKRAVEQFVSWTKDTTNTATKNKYYPNLNKKDLIKRAYIDTKYGHSRGSAVDLTIVSLTTGHVLDMGSAYGLFDEKSSVDYPNITRNQHAVRLLLKRRMEKHGFKSYPNEWWHFTLKDEPFKNKNFDFPVE